MDPQLDPQHAAQIAPPDGGGGVDSDPCAFALWFAWRGKVRCLFLSEEEARRLADDLADALRPCGGGAAVAG